jgi:uncharacterized protein (DUF1810 family)
MYNPGNRDLNVDRSVPMAEEPAQRPDTDRLASTDDIRHIFGPLDDEKLVNVMALQPTVADAEKASLWLAGDADVFGATEPLKFVASKIVTIFTADDEELQRDG